MFSPSRLFFSLVVLYILSHNYSKVSYIVVEFLGIQFEVGWAPYKTVSWATPSTPLDPEVWPALHIMCPAGHHTDRPGTLTSGSPESHPRSSGYPYLSQLMLAAASSVLLASGRRVGVKGGGTEWAPVDLALFGGDGNVWVFSGGQVPALRFTTEDIAFSWTPDRTWKIQRCTISGCPSHKLLEMVVPMHLGWWGPTFWWKQGHEITGLWVVFAQNCSWIKLQVGGNLFW